MKALELSRPLDLESTLVLAHPDQGAESAGVFGRFAAVVVAGACALHAARVMPYVPRALGALTLLAGAVLSVGVVAA